MEVVVWMVTICWVDIVLVVQFNQRSKYVVLIYRGIIEVGRIKTSFIIIRGVVIGVVVIGGGVVVVDGFGRGVVINGLTVIGGYSVLII